MVPYGGQGFMVLPNGAALPPQGLPHYMYSFPMPVPGAHQPSIGVIASGPGAASRGIAYRSRAPGPMLVPPPEGCSRVCGARLTSETCL